MDQFNTLNHQQQPFIQSGYGAMSRLNTLLGLGGGGGAAPASAPGPGPAYRPTTGGGVQQIVQAGAQPQSMNPNVQQSLRLKQILALRAANGDTEAARMMGQV
jgi:hypothetical protein